MKVTKTFVLVLSFCLFQTGFLFAQDDAWNRIQPTPQEHSLSCIRQIPGTETIVAVGNGSTIMYSEDEGENWDIKLNPAGLPNNTLFLSVIFFDELNGYAAANYGRIIRTTDGGENWELIYNNVNDSLKSDRVDIYLLDSETAIVVGFNRLILKTEDSGENWVTSVSPEGFSPNSIDFIDQDTGYIVGLTDSAIILKTIDGGNSWSAYLLNDGNPGNYFDIKFVSDSVWIMNYIDPENDTCSMFKSINYGKDWSVKQKVSCWGIDELSAKDGQYIISYAYNWGLSFVISSDQGETWEKISGPFDQTWSNRNSVNFMSDYVIAAGLSGRISRAEEPPEWTNLSENTSFSICTQLQFTSNEIGYCHFRIKYSGVPTGVIRKTADGGSTWFNIGYGYSTGDFCFLDDEIGYTVSSYAGVYISTLKTTDGGNEWIGIDDFEPDEYFDDRDPFVIDYYDENHGLMAYPNKIYKSSLVGKYWQEIYSDWDFHQMIDIEYFSIDTFLVVSYKEWPTYSPILMWSYDGGDSFVFDTLDASLNTPYEIYFKDQNTAFMPFENANTILKSTDGGHNWYLTVVNDTSNSSYKSVHFPSEDIGYAVGSGESTTVLKTIDGGETWDPIDIPCSSGLSHVYFHDDWHGFVFGNNGVIMETLTGGLVGIEDNPFTSNQQFIRTYPNPTENTIQFDLPGQADGGGIVELFNLNGEIILTQFVSNQHAQRSIQINVTGLLSGVYFCRLKFNDSYYWSKIIKL